MNKCCHVRYNPIPGEYLNRPQYMRNTMFLNRGEGVYSGVANLMGLPLQIGRGALVHRCRFGWLRGFINHKRC